jgi:hypothetical protein
VRLSKYGEVENVNQNKLRLKKIRSDKKNINARVNIISPQRVLGAIPGDSEELETPGFGLIAMRNKSKSN